MMSWFAAWSTWIPNRSSAGWSSFASIRPLLLVSNCENAAFTLSEKKCPIAISRSCERIRSCTSRVNSATSNFLSFDASYCASSWAAFVLAEAPVFSNAGCSRSSAGLSSRTSMKLSLLWSKSLNAARIFSGLTSFSR